MNHQYSKFKNKAIPYAKVGRRVFGSLFNAETFCSDHGLDVNSAIEYGEIPELKNEVQEIAKYQKAVLREVLHRLEKRCSFLHGEITGFSNSPCIWKSNTLNFRTYQPEWRNRMNRAERRRAKKAGIPVKKEPVVNIKAADVQKIKQDASKEAADKAFLLMLGLPVMVLHDKFGFGPVRCERFTDAVLELYDSFEKGYVSLEDIHLTLKEETGITIVSDGRLKDRGN